MVTQKDCKCPSQRIPVHTEVTSTAGPIPNPLAGEVCWSHTEDTGSWQKWLWKCGLYPTDKPLGTTIQGQRAKATFGEAGGRGLFKGQNGPGKSRSYHLTMMLHCTHINTLTLFYNNCTSHQQSSSSLPPPSKDALSRLKDEAVLRTEDA